MIHEFEALAMSDDLLSYERPLLEAPVALESLLLSPWPENRGIHESTSSAQMSARVFEEWKTGSLFGWRMSHQVEVSRNKAKWVVEYESKVHSKSRKRKGTVSPSTKRKQCFVSHNQIQLEWKNHGWFTNKPIPQTIKFRMFKSPKWTKVKSKWRRKRGSICDLIDAHIKSTKHVRDTSPQYKTGVYKLDNTVFQPETADSSGTIGQWGMQKFTQM